jgi:hypothetical protein
MSKRHAIFLLFLCSFAVLLPSCQYSERALPVVNVDHDHDFLSQHVRNPVPVIQEYKVEAGNGFVLDMSNFEFQVPPSLVAFKITRPNRVYVSIRPGHYANNLIEYYADWNSSGSAFALTTQNLIPVDDAARPFSGFNSGQEVYVLIGFYDPDGKITQSPLFYPFWGADVSIQ